MTSIYHYYFETPEWQDDAEQLINIDIPQYVVSVSSNVTTSNIYTKNLTAYNHIETSNLTAYSNIISYNSVITSNVIALDNVETLSVISHSNIYTSNLQATNAIVPYIISSNINSSNVNAMDLKGLCIGGFPLYEPCPFDHEDFRWYFQNETGAIHISWLRDDANILKDVLDLGANVFNGAMNAIGLANFLKDMFNWVNPAGDFPTALAGALGGLLAGEQAEAVTSALEDALTDGNDDGTASNKFYVSWDNVKDKPVTANSSIFGTNGNIYVSNKKSLNVISSTNFGGSTKNNLQVNTTGAQQVWDFEKNNIWVNELSASSNIFCDYYNSRNSNASIYFQPNRFQSTVFNKNGSTNPNSWTTGTTILTDSNFGFYTQEYSSAPYICQMNVDSNGRLTIPEKITCEGMRTADDAYNMNILSWEKRETFLDKHGSSNRENWGEASFEMSDSNILFSTMSGCNSYINQMRMDSNGKLWVRNGLTMSNNVSITTGTSNNMKSAVNLTNTDLSWTTTNSNNVSALQFNMNSNGTLYLRSNITMSNACILKASGAKTFGSNLNGGEQDYTTEGVLTFNLSNLNYVWRTSYQDYLPATGQWLESKFDESVFLLNSNGMYLNQKNSIYGSNEVVEIPSYPNPLSNITMTSFTRMDMTLGGGLVFGNGLYSNPMSNWYDAVKISRDGEISTLNKTYMTLSPLTNSNADVVKGSFTLCNNGYLMTGNKVLVDTSGTFRRQSGLNNTQGVVVTPSGYASFGSLQIDPYGVLTVGNLKIDQDGSIYCRGVKILDASTGKIAQNAIDYNIGGEIEQANLIDMNIPQNTYTGDIFNF